MTNNSQNDHPSEDMVLASAKRLHSLLKDINTLCEGYSAVELLAAFEIFKHKIISKTSSPFREV